MFSNQNKIYVMFGSQTGNSLKIAKDLHQKLIDLGQDTKLLCLNKYEHINFDSNTILIIITSSYGTGTAPTNAAKFEQFLKNPDTNLINNKIRYAVLGLGHSLQPKFCGFSKFVDSKFEQLSARCILKRGDADDFHSKGRDFVVKPQIQNLLDCLKLEPKFLHSSSNIFEPNIVEYEYNIDSADIEDIESNSGRNRPVDMTRCSLCRLYTAKSSRMCCDLVDRHLNLKKENRKLQLNLKKQPPLFNQLTSHNQQNFETHNLQAVTIADYFPECRLAQVVAARKLTNYVNSNNFKFESNEDLLFYQDYEVQEMELDVSKLGFKLWPGDAFGIHCCNSLESVSNILDRIIDQSELESKNGRINSIEPNAIRNAFSYFFDLTHSLNIKFLHLLCKSTLDVEERQQFEHDLEIYSKQLEASSYLKSETSITETQNFVKRPYLPSFIDIMNRFNSCKPSLDILLDNLNELQPRYYSCASYSTAESVSSRISFTFSVKPNYRLYKNGDNNSNIKTNIIQSGLCTNQLRTIANDFSKSSSLKSTSNKLYIPIFERSTNSSSHFRLPKLNIQDRNYIFICSGTGIAPFRGMIQQISETKKDFNNLSPFIQLLAGFRHPDIDYLYKDELALFNETNILNRLDICFSRYNTHISKMEELREPKYVQDLLNKYSKEILNLILDEKSLFYICGSSSMQSDVHSTFVKILKNASSRTKIEDPLDFVTQMIKSHRYLSESQA